MTAIKDDTPVVVSRRQLSTTLGDEVVILGLDDEVYYGLDGAGARLWNLLQTPRSLIEVVEILLQEFDVTRDRLTADLRALFESLNERGLLTTADSPRA
jgi:Coenzyme PQQ synthesis protein D (PqqD)